MSQISDEMAGTRSAPEDELELLTKAAQGHSPAERELFRKYREKAYRIAYRVTGDQHESDALTVETFRKAFDALRKGTKTRHFSAWIRKIALNLAISERRKSRPLISLDELIANGGEALRRIGDRLATGRTSDNQASLLTGVRAALEDDFPEEYASTMILVLERLTDKEIAEILAIPIGTVRSRRFRGLKILRNRLRDKGDTGP